MAGGTGIRAAAILMAGLVGAAVIAPGVAFAEGTSTVPTCSAGQTVDPTTELCTDAATAPSVTAPSVTQTEVPEAPDTGSTGTGGGSTGSTTTPADTTTTAPAEQSTPTKAAPESGTSGTPVKAAAPAVTTAAVTDSLAGLTGVRLPSGLPISDALQNLPAGNLDLGDLEIPQLPSSGSFTSPRDACLFLASKVTVGDDAIDAVSGQFASFCGALPGSFDPSSGYPDLPSLADALDRLCHGLEHTGHHGHWYPSWWNARYDLDCGQLTYDEAQRILAENPSDPNNLDGDDDGIACERNARDYETVTADYDGYPRGGVATGDSAPGVDPGAAGALAGLALATVAGTLGRREDADRREETAAR